METEGNSAPELVVITRSTILLMEAIWLWKDAQKKDPAIQVTLQRLRKQPKRMPRYTQTPQELLVYEDQGPRTMKADGTNVHEAEGIGYLS